MIRHKWIVGVRNQLASLAMECDSCAAIDGSHLTETERRIIQEHIKCAVEYIDGRRLRHPCQSSGEAREKGR